MIDRPEYVDALWAHKDKPLIKVLTGMRRCGKSTILQMYRQRLRDSGIPDKQILFINLESGAHRALSDDGDLYQFVLANTDFKQKTYLLLDEVQLVKNWEKAINALRVDLDADITLTGSNAYLLSGELATLLAGRYVEIEVFPLSFREFRRFTKESKPRDMDLPPEPLFARYLKYGGLPILFSYEQDERLIAQIMDGLYSTILRRDILHRNQVGDAALLDRVTAFLMDSIGSTISSKKITDTFRSLGIRTTHNTVLNYIEMLKNAFIFYQAKRYDIRGREHLKTLDKYYLCDLGLRHAALGYRDINTGHLLENIVFLELKRRGYKVYIGVLDGYEIDFVAEKRDEQLYVQVCQSIQLEEVRQRELRPLNLVRDNYPKLLLTGDYTLAHDDRGVKIQNVLEYLQEEVE